VELVVGLGETLASSEAPGVPYCMVCNKHTGAVQMLAYASFSHAAWPDPVGGLIRKTVDYSGIKLSGDETFKSRQKSSTCIGSMRKKLTTHKINKNKALNTTIIDQKGEGA
jgi:hypothetical protein